MKKATDEDVREIFAEVDQIEPINPHRRLRLGEKIANARGLTMKVPKSSGVRAFNPFVRR